MVNEVIEKIKSKCLEIRKVGDSHYSIVVDKYNLNAVENLLKDNGAVLQFAYGSFIHIDVKF